MAPSNSHVHQKFSRMKASSTHRNNTSCVYLVKVKYMYVATFLFEFNGRSGLILELDLVRVFCEDYRGVIEFEDPN